MEISETATQESSCKNIKCVAEESNNILFSTAGLSFVQTENQNPGKPKRKRNENARELDTLQSGSLLP